MAIRNVEIVDFPCSSYNGAYGYTGGEQATVTSGKPLTDLGFSLNNAFNLLPVVSGSSQEQVIKTYPNGMKIVGGRYQSGSGWRCSLSIRNSNNQQLGGYGYTSTKEYYGVAFAIDDDTQKGYVIIGTITQSNYAVIYRTPYPTPSDAYYHELYNLLVGNMPVIYDWKSVPAIQGKLGTYNLSEIDKNYLNNGDAVTGSDGSHFTRLVNETRISQLGANIPFNTETPIIYSGSGDMMTYEIVALQAQGQPILIDSYKLRFYVSGVYTAFYECTLTGGLHAPENTWLHFIIDESKTMARLSLIVRNASSSPITYSYNGQSFTDAQARTMYSWLHGHIPPEDREDSTDNISNGNEGGGSWQPWNDVPVPKTGNPTKNALTIGFTTMYKVDDTILKDLSDFLWSDTFVDNVKKLFSDPREIIVGLMLFPVTPSASSNPTEIKAGSIQTGVMAYKLLDQYLTIDMGYIDIHEESSTFLDFPPNTKAAVYLPYCGEHYLDVNQIMGKQLHLEYTFDFLTGAVCANIAVDGSYVYSFTGQCGIQIPTSSEDFGRMYSSVLSAGATLGTAMATLATGGMTAPLMFGMGANMLSNGMSMTPDIQYSSGGGGASGFIANQTPYLRLELPVPLMANGDTSDTDFEATKQYAFIGKPTYQSLTLSSCSGYTKCLDAHLKNIPATEIELAGILRDLKEGVIIQDGNDDPSDTPTVSGNTVITFIKCKSAPNVIGKAWDTNDIEAIEGKIIYNQSISKPQFIIKGDIKGYNYCYIGMFSRYYYITDIVYAENGVQEISMSVDALQSFRTEILACKAIVERQKKKGNLYMTDSYMYTKANKKIVTVPFMGGDNQYINQSGMQTFERQNNSYILTIAGD